MIQFNLARKKHKSEQTTKLAENMQTNWPKLETEGRKKSTKKSKDHKQSENDQKL